MRQQCLVLSSLMAFGLSLGDVPERTAAAARPAQATDPAGVGPATMPASDTVTIRAAAEDLRAGLAHAEEGWPAAAAAAYARAAERVPSLGPWAAFLSATAAARAGDTAAVRRHLAATDAELAREWGWRARVDAALASGDTTAAAQHAESAAAQIRGAGRRAEALARAGTLHARTGRATEAAAVLRRAIDASIGSAAAVDAARALADLRSNTPDDRLLIGRVYLRHGNMTRATEGFDAWLNAGRGTPAERAQLHLDLARGMFDARQYSAAERRLRTAVSAATAASARRTSADALLLLGRAQYRQGRETDARATFVRLTREFPGTAAALRAHFIIADIDHDAGRIESARTHYRAVIEADGPDLAVSTMRLGGLAILEGRHRDAARLFAGVMPRVQATVEKQQIGYWWARSLERAGATDSARLVLADVRRLDPLGFYGLRAAELLGVDIWDFPPSRPAPAPAEALTTLAAGIDAADALRQAGLDDAAAFQQALLVDRFGEVPGALYALGEAYHERGQTFTGISIGRELQRREGAWNRQLLRLVYPFPYRDDVLREARAAGLDPWLVAGLIRQESMFNPRARSGVGAIGLMQVMPATGTRVAGGLGIRPFSTARLTEPVVNLRIGTRYLADQIRSHRGRLVDAIAAYNAGPTRLTRWRQFPEYDDDELFIERIPFDETRGYVRIVQQNAIIYRALYGIDR